VDESESILEEVTLFLTFRSDGHAAPTPEFKRPHGPQGNAMRILIAAESKGVRRAIWTTLEKYWPDTMMIFEAGDGLAALQVVADVDGGVDIVLSDWKLPRLTPRSLLKQLRAMPLSRGVSVIMIANESDKEEVAEALQWGARDYILRPFTQELLKEKVERSWQHALGDTSILLHKIAGHRRRAEDMRGQASWPQPAPELALPGLSGTLDTLPISDLIQILNVCRKTGHLRLIRGPEQAGIYFSEGEARHAWTWDLQGEPALFRIISWKDAVFSFDSGLRPEQPTLLQPTMTLLFEGLRRLDEDGRKPT
jgi:two-component system chemotaxis response regulator CheY